MRHGWRAWRCRGKGGGQPGTVHGEREADRDWMAGKRWRINRGGRPPMAGAGPIGRDGEPGPGGTRRAGAGANPSRMAGTGKRRARKGNGGRWRGVPPMAGRKAGAGRPPMGGGGRMAEDGQGRAGATQGERGASLAGWRGRRHGRQGRETAGRDGWRDGRQTRRKAEIEAGGRAVAGIANGFARLSRMRAGRMRRKIGLAMGDCTPGRRKTAS